MKELKKPANINNCYGLQDSMKADIHNFERRLELVEEGILAAMISRKERRNFQDFEDSCFADGLGLPKVVKCMQSLTKLSNCNISTSTPRQITALLAPIERWPWSAWTKHECKLALQEYLNLLIVKKNMSFS